MTNKEAAIKYAVECGWAVFPVSPENKRPLTPHGRDDAKKDVGAIEHWWDIWPDASIGVATGQESELLVIDEDVDEDKGLDGYHEMLLWERENGALPSSVRSITGRGGAHVFYHYAGNDLTSRTGVIEGVDVRGKGGYVIVPPSKHPNGNTYEWEISPDEMELAEVDDKVREFVTLNQRRDAVNSFNLPEVIPAGSRNETLHRFACSLQARGVPDPGILAAVQEINKTNCIEPLPDDEIRRIVASATKYEKGELAITSAKADADQPPSPPAVFRKLKPASNLMERDIPEPEIIIGVGDDVPFLVEGTCILSAKAKLGKSWFALALCLAVATGSDFLGYKTRKSSVLYLDLETSEPIQKKRLTKALHGAPVPEGFYIETETDTLSGGFVAQIENYIAQDPEIKIVIVDVFQLIRTANKSIKETEYEHAYRDINPLNELAQKHHISIILVCHDRKMVDPDDPFSNILGSTGLQGAVSQMIVMFKKHKDDPIHVSVKGKTIDGIIDLNVKLDDATWSTVAYDPDDETAILEIEYQESQIRKAVLEIAKRSGADGWKGRCSWIIQEACEYDVPIVESPKQVGGFLHRHQGRFLANDGVKISIINNGSGAKTYKISRSTVDTVDENEALTVDGFEKADKYGACEIPFS